MGNACFIACWIVIEHRYFLILLGLGVTCTHWLYLESNARLPDKASGLKRCAQDT